MPSIFRAALLDTVRQGETMDYVQLLKDEAASGHAAFHEYVLLLDNSGSSSLFLFFEGEDDPAFYVPYVLTTVPSAEYYEFVCLGRDEVLKAAELAARDGRSQGRARFFIDKDHSDIVGGRQPELESIYQTDFYSFENFVVCSSVFRRYWVERLRLRITDKRYPEWLGRFERSHRQFCKRSKVLMSCVLIGRGYLGDNSIKLNLNNADLSEVFVLDALSATVKWKGDGLSYFLRSVNMQNSNCAPGRIRKVASKALSGDPKGYVRGKYEVWYFVKFLQLMTSILSSRAGAKSSGCDRAKPSDSISMSNFLSVIGSLTPFPESLKEFMADLA